MIIEIDRRRHQARIGHGGDDQAVRLDEASQDG